MANEMEYSPEAANLLEEGYEIGWVVERLKSSMGIRDAQGELLERSETEEPDYFVIVNKPNKDGFYELMPVLHKNSWAGARDDADWPAKDEQPVHIHSAIIADPTQFKVVEPLKG